MRSDLRGNGSWRPLLTALVDLSNGHAELVRQAERSWASATFSGTRHTIALAFTGAEALVSGEALITALPEHEFTIPGQLVAEATVVSVEQTMLPEPKLTVEMELLLLEEG